jgi:hypothetical protein
MNPKFESQKPSKQESNAEAGTITIDMPRGCLKSVTSTN